MPSIPVYDGTTDVDEHLENFTAYMQMHNTNEATLCNAFCLTLTGATRQWYQRLAPRSIPTFRQLSRQFSEAFLSMKTRKKEKASLYKIK